jgi:hypothetical protein
MRTLAPNSLNSNCEIDDAFLARAFIKFQSPSTFNPLASANLAGLCKDVKPEPRRRTRSFNQRDIARALRAAKAADVEVREIMPDGRIILGTPSPPDAITEDDDILALLR